VKKAVHIFIASIALLALFLAAVPAAAEPAERVDVLIGFYQPPGAAEEAKVRHAGGDIKYAFHLVPVIAASLPEPAIDALLQAAGVRYIEPVIEFYALAQTVPWGIDRVFGDETYPFATWADSRGAGIAVAVLDTGIDMNHEDLNLLGGTNTIDTTHWGADGRGHGTHVGGTIAALNNTWGVVGVAPDVGLYAVKVLDDTGSGTDLSVAKGIEWAVDVGIPVLNMSLGSSSHSQTLQDACDTAYAAGHLLVASAGNSGNLGGGGDKVEYPARYGSVIAVAASNSNDQRASFSSTGSAVELIAPGVNVLSTLPGNIYGYGSGTSMASPHAAGVAALAWAVNPDLTNAQIRGILQDTAEDLGLNPYHQGYGLVRADLAVAAALNTLPPEPGYTFTAPPAIGLGGMAPGTTATGSSTGSLVGDNSNGYTVTGIDAKTSNTVYMVSGTDVLANEFQMGPAADTLGNSSMVQTLLNESGYGPHAVPFYVSQLIAYTDIVATGYTITITFTVTEK